jgi:hypothetical protein
MRHGFWAEQTHINDAVPGHDEREKHMNDETFNNSMRKFLRTVGVTSQQEIEKAVRAAIDSGKLKGNETLPAKMVLTVGGVDLHYEVKGDLELG